jgi:energy-converting hydrogenase Eha subunit F
MKKFWSLLLGTLLTLGIAGCANLKPDWFHPGPAPVQQARAERFDPYPENDIGPPIVGSRPREYQNPVPEVDRGRWMSAPPPQGSAPPPGSPGPAY